VGAMVARELYGVACPVVLLAPGDYARAASLVTMSIDDGTVSGPVGAGTGTG